MTDKKTIANRITALMLTAAIVLSSGTAVFAVGADSVTADEAVYKSVIDAPSVSSETADKDESVYAVMDADGNIEKIIVDELLNNKKGRTTLNDVSYLSDIENISGTEEFTQNGTELTWQADGKAIRYEGTGSDPLPVSVDISYYLNGEEKTAAEMAGQTGNIEIHFDYRVNRMEYPYGYEMFHPYVMASGVSLDNEHFTNIHVDTGKMINSGDNTICMGVALPGLSYNLGIEDGKLDVPESVVISAATDGFSIDGTYTIAMTGVLKDTCAEEMAEKAGDKAAELEAGLCALSEAANKLTRGSGELADGISELAGGIRTLQKKTKQLGPGIKALAKGAKELKDGTAQVLDGTEELKSGAEELDEGVKQLDDGASQLSEGAGELADGAKQLKEGTSKLSKATELMKYGADAVVIEAAVVKVETTVLKRDAIKLEGQTQEVADGLHDLANSDDGMDGLKLDVSADSIELGFDGVASKGSAVRQTARSYRNSISSYKGQLQSALGIIKNDSKRALAKQAIAELDRLDAYLSTVETYVDSVDTASYEASQASARVSAKVNNLKVSLSAIKSSSGNRHRSLEELAAKADDANKTAEKVKAEAITADATATVLAVSAGLLAILANKTDKGAKQVDEGAGQLSEGAQKLSEATSQLAEGVHRLSEGTGELVNGVTRLNEAVALLDGGAGQLSAGLTTLNKGSVELLKGINKLAAGAGKAEAGANELAAGMARFNREGIQAFVAALSGSGITGALDRLSALVEADRASTFYGGKLDRDSGESRIIFKSAAITAPDESDDDSETADDNAETE